MGQRRSVRSAHPATGDPFVFVCKGRALRWVQQPQKSRPLQNIFRIVHVLHASYSVCLTSLSVNARESS